MIRLRISMEPFRRLFDRFTDDEDMSDIIKADDSTDLIDESPFSTFDKLERHSKREKLIEWAENALRVLKRNGTATDESLRDAALAGHSRQQLQTKFWPTVAPLIATADPVEWTGYVEMSEDAPESNTDAWRDAAGQLEIPDTSRYDGVAKAVRGSYRYLKKVNRWNDGPRRVHPTELRWNCGVRMPDRRWPFVLEYLDELQWIVMPDGDGPTWAYATEKAEAADASEAKP